MDQSTLKTILMIAVPALIGAITVGVRISRGRKMMQHKLALRGIAICAGAAALDVPQSPFVPGGANQVPRWSARMPQLALYETKGDRLVAAWRSRAPYTGRFVLYTPPGLGKWFHRELPEIPAKQLPCKGLYAYASDATLVTRDIASAFVAITGKQKNWCFQYVDGVAYLICYEEYPQDPDLLARLAAALDQALALRAAA
jgi:hypothetical protein